MPRKANVPTKEQLAEAQRLLDSGMTISAVVKSTGISIFYIRQFCRAGSRKVQGSDRLFTQEEYEEWCNEWNHWTKVIRERLVRRT